MFHVLSSALLKAISEKLIPGISSSVRILLVSQVEDTSDALEDVNKNASVLTHVIRGDKARTEFMKEFDGRDTKFFSIATVVLTIGCSAHEGSGCFVYR